MGICKSHDWTVDGAVQDAKGYCVATTHDIRGECCNPYGLECTPLVEEQDAHYIVHAANNFPALLAALTELRNVCRVALQAIALHAPDDTNNWFHDELQRSGIADGFGVRANALIATCEGSVTPHGE